MDLEIERYYAFGYEQDRLRSGPGELERLRTEEILRRHLPPAPAVICDIGGAAGIYAFPLSAAGYKVHLADPMPLHLKQAQAHSSESGIELASIVLADARSLNFESDFADVVLLLGPLYHLVETTDRLAALREALRVLKPGGLVVAAAISRFASLIDGLSYGSFSDPQFRQIVADDITSGVHRNPTASPQYFTTAYFHRPEELRAEICESGFEDVKILGVEGPAWGAAQCLPAVADPAQRKTLLEMLAAIEMEPSIAGASAHLLGLARKVPPHA